jgi:hypothetical protein
VEGEDFAADIYVTVVVACDTNFVAQIKTNALGFFDLNVDSRGPQALPTGCQAGNLVTVTGNEVISGQLRRD